MTCLPASRLLRCERLPAATPDRPMRLAPSPSGLPGHQPSTPTTAAAMCPPVAPGSWHDCREAGREVTGDAPGVQSPEPSVSDADGTLRGFLVSAVVHLVVLIVLALVKLVPLAGGGQVTLLAEGGSGEAELDELGAVGLDTSPDGSEPTASEAAFPDATSVGAAGDRGGEPIELAPGLETTRSTQPGADAALARLPAAAELFQQVPTRDSNRSSAIAEGRGALRQSGTAEDAVSGLGGDIAGRLRKGNLLVVWMFDASLSMAADRQAAGKQMIRVFVELDRSPRDLPYHHSQALMCFGQWSQQLVAPTRRWKEVTETVPLVPNDTSGIENVFTALEYAIPEYRKSWKEQLLFIVWTDESGNDVDKLESTIALCREHDVSVSVVGPTAVLGRPRGLQFFQFNQQWSWWLPVDKGPDAGLLQLVQLPHWFGGPPANAMPSGFGPYGLVRLSRQTGGSFTLYDRWAERSRFRLEDLRAYLPDYRDRTAARSDIEKSGLRRAVVEAAEITARAECRDPPQFSFDWPLYHTPAEFRRELRSALDRDLPYVQSTIPLIDEALKRLGDPYLEVELQREPSPRWRANYLLAKGRLLAMSVRAREYVHLASEILADRVVEPGSNEADFQPYGTLLAGDLARQHERQARELLRRCAEGHPHTPWAELAKLEGQYPFSLRFEQRYVPCGGVCAGVPSAPGPPRL